VDAAAVDGAVAAGSDAGRGVDTGTDTGRGVDDGTDTGSIGRARVDVAIDVAIAVGDGGAMVGGGRRAAAAVEAGASGGQGGRECQSGEGAVVSTQGAKRYERVS